MTCLKKDQVQNKGLSRAIGNYERPVYQGIGFSFNETLCGPVRSGYRVRSALHSLLVKRYPCNFLLHHDFDGESSLKRNVEGAVGYRPESKERVQKL